MNGGRGTFQPPAGGEPRAAGAPRRNRLSRTFRQSQAGSAEVLESSRSQREPEFKTPTRISRTRAAPGADSPLNDSDVQQDIIWDAASPSPRRLGKRGKKPAAGAVNISDIVSRIAPEHGRPRVAEPTLQQWIGDSAAIPCTPEVLVPRAKKKSPRLNSVEDLLWLARRFDQNLFHQDEDEEEEGSGRDRGPVLPASAGPEPQLHPEPRLHQDQQLEDDLDLLFDGPTQEASGSLSQAVSQNRPGSGPNVGWTGSGPGLGPGSGAAVNWHGSQLGSGLGSGPGSGPGPAVNGTGSRPSSGPAVNWNGSRPGSGPSSGPGSGPAVKWTESRPGSGSGPGSDPGPAVNGTGSGPGSGPGPVGSFEDDWADDDLLSDWLVLEMTQNPLSFVVPTLCSTQAPAGSARVPGRNSSGRVGPSVGTRAEKENLGPSAAINLERTLGSGRRVQTDPDCGSEDVDRFPSGSGAQRSGKPGQTSSFNPAARRSQSSAPDRTARTDDFLDDDLDSLFSSEPVWDDPADDDLLCETCDELENRILIQVLPSNQRAPLQPAHRTADNWFRADPAGGSLAAGVPARVNRPIRFLQPKPAVSSELGSTGSEPPAAPPPTNIRAFTFRKPGNLVTTATATGKCSAAEIEQKKQQALERRRRRLQAATGRPVDA